MTPLDRDATRSVIGVRFQRWRLSCGRNQWDIALVMAEAGFGWDQRTVSRIEQGHRRLYLDEWLTLAFLVDEDPNVLLTA